MPEEQEGIRRTGRAPGALMDSTYQHLAGQHRRNLPKPEGFCNSRAMGLREVGTQQARGTAPFTEFTRVCTMAWLEEFMWSARGKRHSPRQKKAS
ncbi:hypothetical protein EYF80_045370 [Liparis tanakae]|uniref:Uncharacterized protein n=1 Tax=Liparis tanakae TaxID=230148 RepID=A0A4Z2FT73_9TELE|nr:hypothetical protein EYF80_045370 [Liparis tanakae]